MSKTSIIGAIRASIGISKTNRLQEKYMDAVQHLHRLEADLLFLSKMHSFHTSRHNKIDHESDWWGFAAAKQKAEDYRLEVEHAVKKIEEQQACVDARCAALTAHYDVC